MPNAPKCTSTLESKAWVKVTGKLNEMSNKIFTLTEPKTGYLAQQVEVRVKVKSRLL